MLIKDIEDIMHEFGIETSNLHVVCDAASTNISALKNLGVEYTICMCHTMDIS